MVVTLISFCLEEMGYKLVVAVSCTSGRKPLIENDWDEEERKTIARREKVVKFLPK